MILTFDLATNTGWCAGAGDDFPMVGHVTMPSTGEDIGAFGLFWRRWLTKHIEYWKPAVVVFESPILPRETTLATTRKLQGLAYELEVACKLAGVPCEEVAGATIKKYLTGDGKAKKPDMMRWARKVGVEVKTSDEADAFAVWLHALQYHARPHVPTWDARRFQGAQLL